jgi:hypothetical protein
MTGSFSPSSLKTGCWATRSKSSRETECLADASGLLFSLAHPARFAPTAAAPTVFKKSRLESPINTPPLWTAILPRQYLSRRGFTKGQPGD